MVHSNYYPIFFQPVSYPNQLYANYVPQSTRINPNRLQITYKLNEYFLRGIVYVQYILKLLLSSSPFLEQYGPVIKEIPKMYQIMKAFKEVDLSEFEQNEKKNRTNVENTFKSNDPLPKLFI